jgi:hypothetical protein
MSVRRRALCLLLATLPSSVALGAPDAGVQAAPDASAQTAPHPPRESEAATQRLNRELAAATRNRALSDSPDPVLKHHPGGSYTFHGNGIDATIEPDGTVHFHDKVYEGRSFDVFGWADKLAHNDPFRSERRWFLERTRPLREQLACADLSAAAQLSREQLEQSLARIWRYSTLTCERRQQETMRLWAAAALNKQPDVMRASIERFMQMQDGRDPGCSWSARALREANPQPIGCLGPSAAGTSPKR